MDEETVNQRGLDPLRPSLDRIATIRDKAALIEASPTLTKVG